MGLSDFAQTGWCAFAAEPNVRAWVDAVAPLARGIAKDPTHTNAWLRHQQTWFVGVNILPNDGQGAIANGPALTGAAMDWVRQTYGPMALEPAQMSVISPGYPLQDPDESDANHKFRRDRDAAHVDGLLPIGPMKRRHLMEQHAYVLGIPLTQADTMASPMVIWEGSHIIMREAFVRAFKDRPPKQWSDVDVTDLYKTTRKQCFEVCERKVVHVPVGGAYVLHRHALHGVAPWGSDAQADPDGRIIAYFRPELPKGNNAWLSKD